MAQPYHRTEGIVLRAFPYRDYDQIVSLFTADAGVIKIMCYGSRSQRSKWRSLCLPLTRVEIVYREKLGEIFECSDLTLMDAHSSLKQQFQHMEAACDLLNALHLSQLPGKEAPQLYALLIFYLNKIPLAKDPWTLAMSYRLKLLKHEGIMGYPSICHECQQLLVREAFWLRSEMLCAQHQVPGSLYLSQADLQLIHHLAFSQNYRDLAEVILPDEFKNKVHRLFQECLKG